MSNPFPHRPIPKEIADEVIGIVSEAEGLPREMLYLHTRKMNIVSARNICAYIFSELGYSNSAIGDVFGMNHSSIHHAIHSFADAIYVYPAMERGVCELLNMVKSAI